MILYCVAVSVVMPGNCLLQHKLSQQLVVAGKSGSFNTKLKGTTTTTAKMEMKSCRDGLTKSVQTKDVGMM